MRNPDSDPGFARLFDGFEADIGRRVAAPGADAARRVAYYRGRRNSRVVTAFTAVAAVGVGSGVTWALAGGGGGGTEPVSSAIASTVPTPTPVASSPAPDTRPSIPTSPTTNPTTGPTTSPKVGNMSLNAPAELRLKNAPAGGFHGKLTFAIRVDGAPAVSSFNTVYDLGDSLEFESNVESSALNTCVTEGGPNSWRCSIEDQIAVGASRSYDLNVWTGIAATGREQVLTLKLSVRLFDGGSEPHSQDQTPANNTATVRVIVPRA